MKSYSLNKVIDIILDGKRLHTFKLYATSQLASPVAVTAHDDVACYSQGASYYSKINKIVLGKKFYPKHFYSAPKNIPVTDIKERYKHIASTYYGLFYHELFHLLYTPFGKVSDYVGAYDNNFQQFAFQVSNILEDATIEQTGRYWYPACNKFLDVTTSVFSEPQYLELQEDAIKNHQDSPETLLSYLLLYVRGIDLSQFSEYKLWEDNKEFIEWGAYKCINTSSPDERVKKQVAYAIQLYKIFAGEAPDKKKVDDNVIEEPPQGPGGTPGGTIISNTYGTDPGEGQTAQRSWTHPQTTPQSAEIPDESEMKDIRTAMQAQHNPSSSSVELSSNVDLTTSGISMLAADSPVINQPHWADDLNSYVDTTQYMDAYMRVVAEHEKEIRAVVAQIRKLKALNNSDWKHYKMTGKLDMSTIYKKGNYKVFKKKNAPKEEAELVFEILVDNSGSMQNNKARLAGRALIIFCEALNRLHIPFSVDAFTEGSESITISLKHYEQLYDKVKTNMTLFTEQYNCSELSTWCGNVDEANVRYVASELSSQPQKDKVLIIISDGATCGSKEDLRKVSESIEASGITVLGIGIYDHNVEDIYSKHLIISRSEDLEKLGTFLNKYLVKLIFKGGNE